MFVSSWSSYLEDPTYMSIFDNWAWYKKSVYAIFPKAKPILEGWGWAQDKDKDKDKFGSHVLWGSLRMVGLEPTHENFKPSNWNVVSIHADQLLRNCRNKLCRLPKCTWTNLHKYYTRKKGVFFNLSFAAKKCHFWLF